MEQFDYFVLFWVQISKFDVWLAVTTQKTIFYFPTNILATKETSVTGCGDKTLPIKHSWAKVIFCFKISLKNDGYSKRSSREEGDAGNWW